jgi:thymidylate synthase ThyX
MKNKVNITAHSLSPQGDELITVLATFPRIILAEINTHRMLSKNTSSSRAIPFKKMVESVQNNPFIPIAWQKEHTGMQGYEYITDKEQLEALEKIWLYSRDEAVRSAKAISSGTFELDLGIKYNYGFKATKQLANRLLEPFMWTTMLITGSREGWNNFFNLRCPQYKIHQGTYKSKKEALEYGLSNGELKNWSDLDWLQNNEGHAEIHIMDLAEKIYDAVNESTPKQLKAGEWHIPFEDEIRKLDIPESVKSEYYKNGIEPHSAVKDILIKVSTAMSAHTSYTVVGNEPIKSIEKWIELHDKLIGYDPPHSSPMEHCCLCVTEEEYNSSFKGQEKGWFRNYKSFKSYRQIIEESL